ncbi:hypothetical protein GCM10010109_18150 [Actinoplanes campanulatus]|nr:hypothetical protein GCM10010109_18150 [Actinoplanes campanulatus]GID36333.1 hypothetical protein Aca09nite_28390 [Actinoplanes campanulatus]
MTGIGGYRVSAGGGTDESCLPAQPVAGVWHLGPFPVRAYALCILLGIIVAVLITQRRRVARSGKAADVTDVAMWAVPFGIAGGHLYHVNTDPQLYFAQGRNPIAAPYIWQCGLGIWGAVALGPSGPGSAVAGAASPWPRSPAR